MTARATRWASCVAGLLMVGASHAQTDLVVGSKSFTESVVLGEIATAALRERGLAARHHAQLGGSRILFEALQRGDIDLYPEYTGTLCRELLREAVADQPCRASLPGALEDLGLVMSTPLGFNNTYALGMREDRARELRVKAISDLRRHESISMGFSSEFMDRGDGWPALQTRYRLPQTDVRGLDHDLAYRALRSGDIDVIDLYSTDAEIEAFGLTVLEDDLQHFPRYDAVFLHRLEDPRQEQIAAMLRPLGGAISADTMRALNAQVRMDGRSEAQAAASYLGLTAKEPEDRWLRIATHLLEHLMLVASSLAGAILIAVPLGVLAARRQRLGQVVLSLSGLLQTIPSLALFVFMIPLFGIGAPPALAALFLYSLLPIVRNTHAGLVGIPRELRESTAVLGLKRSTILRRVELPLAMRDILAGIKIAAVINVGTATLGALIGAGGLGQPILTGIRLDDTALILEGAIPAALLALAVQGLFDLAERKLTPRGLRL